MTLDHYPHPTLVFEDHAPPHIDEINNRQAEAARHDNTASTPLSGSGGIPYTTNDGQTGEIRAFADIRQS